MQPRGGGLDPVPAAAAGEAHRLERGVALERDGLRVAVDRHARAPELQQQPRALGEIGEPAQVSVSKTSSS